MILTKGDYFFYVKFAYKNPCSLEEPCTSGFSTLRIPEIKSVNTHCFMAPCSGWS